MAKALNGKVTANSGATMWSKGDCYNDSWLIECKTCVEEKKSFSIKKEWLDKNKEEAFAMRKPYNALAFRFSPDGEDYYIVDEKTFKRLMEVM